MGIAKISAVVVRRTMTGQTVAGAAGSIAIGGTAHQTAVIGNIGMTCVADIIMGHSYNIARGRPVMTGGCTGAYSGYAGMVRIVMCCFKG